MACDSAAAVFALPAKAPAKRVEWLCTQQRSTACAPHCLHMQLAMRQTPLK